MSSPAAPAPPPFPLSRLLLLAPRLTDLLRPGPSGELRLEPDDTSSSAAVLAKALHNSLWDPAGRLQKEGPGDTLKFIGYVEALTGFMSSSAIDPGAAELPLDEAADLTATLAAGGLVQVLPLGPDASLVLCYRDKAVAGSVMGAGAGGLLSDVSAFVRGRAGEDLGDLLGSVSEYVASGAAARRNEVARRRGKIDAERVWRVRNDSLRSRSVSSADGRTSDITIEEGEEEEGGGVEDQKESAEDREIRREARRKSMEQMDADIEELDGSMQELGKESPLPYVTAELKRRVPAIVSSLLATFFPSRALAPPGPLSPAVLDLPTIPPLSALLSLPSPLPSPISHLPLAYFHFSTFLYATFPLPRPSAALLLSSLPPPPSLGFFLAPQTLPRGGAVPPPSFPCPPFGSVRHFPKPAGDFT